MGAHCAGPTSRRWRDAPRRSASISFWLPDHLLFRFPRSIQQGAWDAWSLLAALAATTRTIEIGPLVACTSFRNPALIAKMADTIDEISGGRLILGLGAGWHEPEYAAFGFPYDHRVSRFDEALQIITALLRTGHVDFQGTTTVPAIASSARAARVPRARPSSSVPAARACSVSRRAMATPGMPTARTTSPRCRR